MTHPVDEMQAAARAAIARMQEAAVAARRAHAEAELMRHMRATAAKLAALPLEQATSQVADEWMHAWGLAGAGYRDLLDEVHRFARAFCLDGRGSDAATQDAVRAAIAGLERGFAAKGLSIADEMAFRSECAHGWWGRVVPVRGGAGQPFWAEGAAPHCGAAPI